MRLLPFSWFSMKLGVIKSFSRCVFYNDSKIYGSEKKYRILTKISLDGFKITFLKSALLLQ